MAISFLSARYAVGEEIRMKMTEAVNVDREQELEAKLEMIRINI